MTLKLYGFMISQPTRSVAWLCKVKGLDYEFVSVFPQKGEANNEEFLKMNPNGLVPVIKDGDFTLFEGGAILAYLAEKHGWTDVFPTDVQQRAKVNQYLHWHHTNARKATPEILVSYISKVNGAATPAQLEFIDKKDEIIGKFTGIIEKLLVKPYIAESEQPTLADYACYCELNQIEAMGVFDFSKYPNVQAWLARMKTIPHHDEVHAEVIGLIKSLNISP